jgi:hypothetical protein
MSQPDQDSDFWKSPALKWQSEHYPERFAGRVPMQIKMLTTILPDLGFLSGCPPETILRCGIRYHSWVNSHGAVAGLCSNGFRLGVKPDEFTVVEWYQPTNLPNPQCSSGTPQSRPSPTRAVKVMQSAGNHEAKPNAGEPAEDQNGTTKPGDSVTAGETAPCPACGKPEKYCYRCGELIRGTPVFTSNRTLCGDCFDAFQKRVAP